MRHGLVVLLVAVLLLTFAAAAGAQTEADKLREQVKQLQQALQDVCARLQKLEAAEAAPAVVVAAPAAPTAPKWYDKVKVGGYLQGRYEDRRQMLSNFPPGALPPSSVEGTDEFLMRRAYLGFVFTPNERTTAAFTLRHLSFASAVDIEAAYVNYKFARQWEVEFGRVYNRFGWDAWESSSRRLPLERFAGVEGYKAAGIRGLEFQGPTDHGIYVTHNPKAPCDGWEPAVHVGFINGNFLNAENNNNKTYEIDLRWARPFGQFGASWVDGRYTEGVGTPSVATTTDRQMLDLWLHTDPKPWGFQTELVDGKLFGYDVRGGYGQVARLVGDGTAYLRYETFDPTRDLDGDSLRAWKLGYAYQLDSRNELTLEFMDADRAGREVGEIGFQWQTGY
ncbi:MAG: porin [Armatimonadia bacterium]